MDAQPWLENLRRELAHKNLPPFYVERIVEELSDHLTDFMEDRMSTDAKDLRSVVARLGTARDVATAAHSEYQRTSFWGRHPFLGFIVLPVVALPLAWAAAFAVVLLIAQRLGLGTGGNASPALSAWANWATPGVVFGLLFTPIVVIAALICRQGGRSGVNWKWTVIACSVVAVVGGTAMANVVLPHGNSHGTMHFGFGLSQVPSVAQTIQFAVPLALGIWAGWRQSERGRSVLAG